MGGTGPGFRVPCASSECPLCEEAPCASTGSARKGEATVLPSGSFEPEEESITQTEDRKALRDGRTLLESSVSS